MSSYDSIEKEVSPKYILYSIIYAGTTVNSCRTVVIYFPVYYVVLSHMGFEGLGEFYLRISSGFFVLMNSRIF